MIRLPVIKTVIGAYYYLWEERLYLWQLTLPPLVVLAILKTLVQWGTVSSIDIGSKIAAIDIYRSGWVAVLFYVAFFVNIWVLFFNDLSCRSAVSAIVTSKIHLVLYTVKVPTGLIFEFLGIPAIGASEVI